MPCKWLCSSEGEWENMAVKLLNSPLLVVFWQQEKDTLHLKCISVFNFVIQLKTSGGGGFTF